MTTIRVASNLDMPLFVTHAPGDANRIYIVEKPGRIKVLDLGTGVVSVFLDITARVGGNGSLYSEQGLLGLAFHPNFATHRFFYVNYTNNSGDTRVSRFEALDSDNGDSGSEFVISSISQPQANHNGGWLAFGPNDGYLYIATGDGGGAGDDDGGHTFGTGNGQDITNNLLGKMLRIDVDGGSPYAIPPDNPFVGISGDDEIWAYGLRNPWRNAFDRETGDLYIADVGQDDWEEISFQLAASTGGENYGWRCREGAHNFLYTPNCAGETFVEPFYEYRHSFSFFCSGSITGGEVYRGCAIPDLDGTYFFADWCSEAIWSIRRQEDGTFGDIEDRTSELAPGGGLVFGSIASFGTDANGEMYICDQSGGQVFKIVAPVSSDCNDNGKEDSCDIDSGFSEDCDGNGLPDECDPPGDCNGNGVQDICDIAAGNSQDCNGNRVPDECETDCNGNGLPDECDIDSEFSEDCNGDGVPDECETDCNDNGLPDECDIDSEFSEDCDENGVPDECDSLTDCNGNGVQDSCDISVGTSDDCNENRRPDECDIDSGVSEDCNGNGRPDECEPLGDCNENGIQDICDIAAGTNNDCNGNGVPDACELDGDGQVIYSNKNGQFLFRPGRGTRVADDLITKLVGSCSLNTLRVRVTGGVEGGGGVFRADISLYDACPSAGGSEIPGSLVMYTDLQDDLERFHDLILDYSDRGICDDGSSCLVSQRNCTDQSVCMENPLEIPPTVWVRLRFDTDEAAIVAGSPPTIGFSSDGLDALHAACRGWFAGWPTFPHASFWVELTAPVDCEKHFPAYSAANPNRPPFLPTDIAGPDVGSPTTRLGDDIRLSVDDCILDAFEIGMQGFAGPYETSIDLRWPSILDVIPETIQTFFGTGKGSVEVARFTIPPEIELIIDRLDQPIYITWAADFEDSPAGVLEVDFTRVGESAPEFFAFDTDPNHPETWNSLFQPNGSPAVFYAAVYCRGEESLGGCNCSGIPDECDIDCGSPGGPCDLPGCGLSVDCNGNGVPDDCDVDSDGDGFVDDCDDCLDSDLTELIILGDCPTGVPNELLDDGCTMKDVLTECSVGAHSHGQLTACVVRQANEWRRQGLLSGKDVGRIAQCAGTSNERRPSKRIKDGRSRGRR